VLFGLMHDRWLAAALAGALYAMLMCRRGRLSDAIAAHMATNAVIFGWAIAAGQWSLL
jgi:membrane protease YdiL (CAAX protease family)